MDQATQQNAALVEEMAAAASSLKGQAQELVATVAVFKLAQGEGQTVARSAPAVQKAMHSRPTAPAPKKLTSSPMAKPAAKPPTLAAPAKLAPVKASADSGGDWESF
jgi:hypothetical protein